MRFWVVTPLLYGALLAGGLALPALTVLLRQPTLLQVGGIYAAALLVLGGAAFLLTLMAARLLFPQYWWMGQVLGQDVYELQGVFFVGVRLSRIPARLQRLVFGAGETFRRWDVAFGILWMLLAGLHGLGAMTSYRSIQAMLPRPIRLPETMHAAFLSGLPAMRELRQPWRPDAELQQRLLEQSERVQQVSGKTEADWFKLAQLHLLRAYKVRHGAGDAYTFSPMDRAYFERGIGAQSADYLNQILSVPEAKRAPLTRGAQTLLGFFFLCEYNYEKAERPLAEALSRATAPDASGIPVTWTRLLAAQVALMQGQGARARSLLEAVLAEPALPRALEALAIEHLAEARRIDRAMTEVVPLLDKAAGMYAALGDGGGEARVHLRRAVWLTDEGGGRSGAEELSEASTHAETAGDVFAQNMVVRMTHLLPALR